MSNRIKDFIKNIDWREIFGSLICFILLALFIRFVFIESLRDRRPDYSADTLRKFKVCQTYSNDFWRNDVDFIDGKCYYKGKEVEIR